MSRPLHKIIFKRLLVFSLLSMITTFILHGQNDNEASYELFDRAIGKTNSGIFNGIQYFEKYKAKNDKHQFFQHKFFIWGFVVYKNQPYYKTALKYNVYTDELLIKNSEVLNAPITQLDKNSIKQFELNGHLFKNVSFTINQDKTFSGFVEVISENDAISVFKKHQKKLSRTAEEEVRFEFKSRFQYYVRFKNDYYLLKKINSLTSILPEYKTQLKNSFKKHESLRKTNPDKYLASIINDLNAHILNKI